MARTGRVARGAVVVAVVLAGCSPFPPKRHDLLVVSISGEHVCVQRLSNDETLCSPAAVERDLDRPEMHLIGQAPGWYRLGGCVEATQGQGPGWNVEDRGECPEEAGPAVAFAEERRFDVVLLLDGEQEGSALAEIDAAVEERYRAAGGDTPFREAVYDPVNLALAGDYDDDVVPEVLAELEDALARSPAVIDVRHDASPFDR